MAAVGPRRSGAWSGRVLGTRPETTLRRDRLPPRAGLEVRDVVAPHAAATRAKAGDGAPPRAGRGGRVRGRADAGARAVTAPRLVAAEAGAIDGKAVVPRWRGTPCRAAGAMGGVGDRGANRRQGIWAVGRWPVRQACAAWAGQGRASAPQVAGGAPRARIARRLRAPPAAPQHGDVLGVDRVMVGRAARAGRQRAGLAEDTREAVCSPEGRTPVPGQQTVGRADARRAVRGDRLEKRCGGGLQVTVPQGFPGLVEEAHVHGAGVEIDATVRRVRCGVESPGGLLLVRDEGCCHAEQTTVVCSGGGLNKYQPPAADALQPPLRCGFQARLRRSVGRTKRHEPSRFSRRGSQLHVVIERSRLTSPISEFGMYSCGVLVHPL
jgi:hypothetical protein